MSSVSDQPGEGGGWDDVFAADSMDGSFDALGTGASPAPQNQSWDLVLADLGAHDHAYDLLPLDADSGGWDQLSDAECHDQIVSELSGPEAVLPGPVAGAILPVQLQRR